MMCAWEVTADDVQTVLERHIIKVDEDKLQDIFDHLDHDAIVSGVLHYTDFDAQVASMLDDIENQLMERGIIPAVPKQFICE